MTHRMLIEIYLCERWDHESVRAKEFEMKCRRRTVISRKFKFRKTRNSPILHNAAAACLPSLEWKSSELTVAPRVSSWITPPENFKRVSFNVQRVILDFNSHISISGVCCINKKEKKKNHSISFESSASNNHKLFLIRN